MKTSITTILLMGIVIIGYSQKPPTQVLLVPAADSSQLVSFSLDVMNIIDAKCIGCHAPNARNEKARKALQWEKLQMMEKMDAYAQLDEISEVLEEGSMPPKRMVERYPNMKLSEKEIAVLKDWVSNTLTKIEGE